MRMAAARSAERTSVRIGRERGRRRKQAMPLEAIARGRTITSGCTGEREAEE